MAPRGATQNPTPLVPSGHLGDVGIRTAAECPAERYALGIGHVYGTRRRALSRGDEAAPEAGPHRVDSPGPTSWNPRLGMGNGPTYRDLRALRSARRALHSILIPALEDRRGTGSNPSRLHPGRAARSRHLERPTSRRLEAVARRPDGPLLGRSPILRMAGQRADTTPQAPIEPDLTRGL